MKSCMSYSAPAELGLPPLVQIECWGSKVPSHVLRPAVFFFSETFLVTYLCFPQVCEPHLCCTQSP